MSKGRHSTSRRAQRLIERELFGPEPGYLPVAARSLRASQGVSRAMRPGGLDPDEHAAVCCAIGRLMRIMSRPYQDGDIEQYEQCRRVVLDTLNHGE